MCPQLARAVKESGGTLRDKERLKSEAPQCFWCTVGLHEIGFWWSKQLSTATQSPTANHPVTHRKQRASHRKPIHTSSSHPGSNFSLPISKLRTRMLCLQHNRIPTASPQPCPVSPYIRFDSEKGIKSAYLPGSSVPRLMISI